MTTPLGLGSYKLVSMQIRLDSVYPEVDHIVVVESAMSHQGALKPLHFQENASRFARFADKIIHIALDYLPGDMPYHK